MLPSPDTYGGATAFAEPKSFTFLERALGWPEPLTIPPAVSGALDVLCRVGALPLPSRPSPTPAEVLDPELGDCALDAIAVEALVAPKRSDARKQVAAVAARELDAAINTHADALWSEIDRSFAAAFAKLATIDTALPARLSAVDAARMTAATRKEIEAAEKINAIMDAASRLAVLVVNYQHGNTENAAYSMLRLVTFPDQATFERWKAGVHFRDDTPLDGSTHMTWAARAGCTPSIARSHAIRESRWAELRGDRPSEPAISGRSRTLERGPTDRDAMHVDLY